MTRLQQTEKTTGIVKRETGAYYRGRAIMVELRPPATIALRLKKSRKAYPLNVVTAFEHAVKIEAAALLKRRQDERKARRVARGQK